MWEGRKKKGVVESMDVLLRFKTGSHVPQTGLKHSQDLGAKMKMYLVVSCLQPTTEG